MASSSILAPTIVDYANHSHQDGSGKSTGREPSSSGYASKISSIAGIVSLSKDNLVHRVTTSEVASAENEQETHDNPEFKLPSWSSLFIVIGGNAVFQLSFYIIVSSASIYSELLGGSATFSGLIIGIPTFFSGIGLIFSTRYDRDQYTRPFNVSYTFVILGNIVYALALRTGWLYMILLGRIFSGFGFICFMYSKRFCTDSRIVGIRRRTTLASWLVVGQAFGFSAGPFLGGLLYKIGFPNKVFNGVTSPGWIMAGIWILFLGLSNLMFEDVPPRVVTPAPDPAEIELSAITTGENQIQATRAEAVEVHHLNTTRRQWGVIVCMCYYAMTCFFILGAWEANIPVFTAKALNYTPYNAGNFIALGGITSFPFLLLNVRYARRVQDRITLAVGSTLGFLGILTFLGILLTDKVTRGSLFFCWALIALGFNLASTCTFSLLSKQFPDTWNGKLSMAIQYSNYTGRVTGAILGGAGVKIGMVNYCAIQMAIVGLGGVMYLTLWKQLKAKTG